MVLVKRRADQLTIRGSADVESWHPLPGPDTSYNSRLLGYNRNEYF